MLSSFVLPRCRDTRRRDIHAARPRRLEQAQRGVDLRPVLPAGGLHVRDLHADARLLADANRLVDGVEEHRGLAAI